MKLKLFIETILKNLLLLTSAKILSFLMLFMLSFNSFSSEITFKFEGILPPLYFKNQNLKITKDNMKEHLENGNIKYTTILNHNYNYKVFMIELDI